MTIPSSLKKYTYRNGNIRELILYCLFHKELVSFITELKHAIKQFNLMEKYDLQKKTLRFGLFVLLSYFLLYNFF